MKALIVDDSRLAATALLKTLDGVDPGGTHEACLDASKALVLCDEGNMDVVFLDIEMPAINGLEFARRLKVRAPQTNVVFVTGYPEYALDAWNTQASAFLVKPVDAEDVRRALESLRVLPGKNVRRGLFVRCFGNFEIFCDGRPVQFERHLTKELMAYLVDRRGAMVTTGELLTVLWEDKPDTASRRSQLRTLISDLRRTLERLGYPNVVQKRRGGVAIRLDAAQCDYFGFVVGDPDAINQFRGEYMRQYSWAEPTTALLSTG